MSLGDRPIELNRRDAVHVPIISVQVTCDMEPGSKVKLVEGRHDLVEPATEDADGVIDPFMRRIYQGGYYWLCLFPGSINSLVHQWEATKFTPRSEAELYIRRVALDINTTQEDLMDVARQYVKSGRHTYDNTEDYKDARVDWNRFWFYFEVLEGAKPEDRDCPFTCSC